VRLGTFHLHSVPPWTDSITVVKDQFAEMLAADEHGLDELWLAEHSARPYGMVGNTPALATALAAATKRIRIATAVCRLPLHNPLHVAEDLSYADALSGGRVDLGVGKGYDLMEFGSYGVDFEEREERWKESFDAIRHFWRTGQIKWDGSLLHFGEGTFLPATARPEGLPIYVMVSGSASSIKMAAELLLPIASGSGPTPEELRTRLDTYAQLASDAGHKDEDIARVLSNCWQLKPLHVAESRDRAIAEYQKGLEWYMDSLANRSMFGFARERKPYSYFVEHESVLLGSPESIVDSLLDYCERSGVNNVICWVNMGGQPHDQVLRAFELMGTEVLPRVKGKTFDWVSSLTAAAPEPV
jgi:alkanesulfonate monooxygenase SsuD/methylene tetrahydromethanopterin reductase-like flavin-dependent oxidoreductase (luciferase family)